MSGSGWLGKIKSGAKSLQETAKNRLEKVSETLDSKLKEARDDLEKQRQTDTTASALPTVKRWRPSTDNPDGELVAEVKPPPPTEQPVVQPTVLSSASSTDLPAIPEAAMAAEEPVTIPRSSKHKRRSTKTSESKNIPVKTGDANDERTLSISEATPTAFTQEVANDDSNVVSTKEATPTAVSQEIANGDSNAVSTKEATPTAVSQESANDDSNAVSTKEATNDELVYSVPIIATAEQEKSIPSTSETPEEIAQGNSTTDVPNSSVNDENLSIEQPAGESTRSDKSGDEQYASSNESRPEITPIDQATDKTSVLENVESKTSHDQSAMELSTTEYTTTDTLDQEPNTIKDNNEPSQGYPDTEKLSSATPDDNVLTYTNIIDANVEQSNPIERTDASDLSIITSNPKDSVDNVAIDEVSSSAHGEEEPVEQPSPANALITATNADDTIEVTDEKGPVLTCSADLPIEDSNLEAISNDAPVDEYPASRQDDEIVIEQSITENTKADNSDYEPITSTDIEDTAATNYGVHETRSLTNYTDLPKIDVKPESISTDEPSPLTQNKEPLGEESNSQYQEPDILDYEPLTATKTDDTSVQRPASLETAFLTNDIDLTTEELKTESIPIDIPANELSTSTYNDDIPVDQYNSKDEETEAPDHELPVVKDTDEPSTEQTDLNEMPDEKLLTPSDASNLPIVDPHSDDTLPNAETNELPASGANDQVPADQLDLQNTTVEISDYEPPVKQNDKMEALDEKASVLTDDTDLPITHTKTEDSSTDRSDDEFSVPTHSDDTPVEQYNLEPQETDIPDYKLPTSNHIEESSVKQSDTIEMPDEEVPLVTNTIELSPVDEPVDESSALTYSDDVPVQQYNTEDQETEIFENEPPAKANITQPAADLYIEEEFLEDIPNSELVVSTENEKATVEQTVPENVQTKILDDALPTAIDTATEYLNEEDILQDDIDYTATRHSRINENISTDTPIDVPKTYAQLDSISLDLSDDDEVPTTTVAVDSSNVTSDSKNILMNIPDEELPVLTDIEPVPNDKPEPENILLRIPDDQLPSIEDLAHSSNPTYDVENILMDIPDDELPTFNPITDNILMSIPDDDLPTIDSTEENFQMILTDAKLPAVNQTEEISFHYSLVDDTNVDNLSKSSPTTSVPIEQFESKDKPSISADDLEDSFEELKVPDIPVQQTPPPPLQINPQLTSLRQLISKFEDDDDDDDDAFLAPVETKTIVPEEKKVKIENKPSNPSTTFKTRLPSSSSSNSDDNPDDLFGNLSIPTHSSSDIPSTNNTIDTFSTVSLKTILIEKKRSSIVNSHFIPAGTKLLQITCSSAYIYLCTTERKIYYAKFNTTNLNELYKWQLHTDLAEQLFVSDSNRTVWRLHNKLLYTGNDPTKYPPLGSLWTKIKLDNDQSYSSISINDQCGWFIKNDGTLWLLRTDDRDSKPMNVPCPFNLNRVFCFSEKIGVSTNDGQILIRTGCTADEPEGAGWIFIDPNLGLLDDFVVLTSNDTIVVLDEKHHLWMHQWSNENGFYEILCDDDLNNSNEQRLMSVNSQILCLTNGKNQIHVFSDCLTGVQWKVVEKNTGLQRLIGAFSNEDYVWALTADRRIGSSNGKTFAKPRQAQNITHATFVPANSSTKTVLWSLDQSCGVYVRPDLENNTEWEQANQVQFESRRRLINIVCSNKGVWAIDDQGHIYFRHGHISASQQVQTYGATFLPPAWIQAPGEAERRRSFTQIFCGPADWMVYATDNKQTVYTRVEINEENPIGTSWKAIEDCSALELALSEHTLWLLTSFGEIQCRENISLTNPIGTRSTTLSGRFLSLTASMDDSQVWAIDSQRNLLKLDRLSVAFEK